MKSSIWELINPNLNIFASVILCNIVPLNLSVSQITQSDACLEMLTAFGTPCTLGNSSVSDVSCPGTVNGETKSNRSRQCCELPNEGIEYFTRNRLKFTASLDKQVIGSEIPLGDSFMIPKRWIGQRQQIKFKLH
jgi:hypothetical protein